MNEVIKNPRLIIKNGFLLFVRLLLVMAMAFYATRLTLQVLGEVDYGINNIVGGIVSMFAIISMPITGALQRFFNVEFTRNQLPRQVVFTTSLRIIALLTIGMIILYETLGLYLVNYVLKYPAERQLAVNIIFQITVLTTICNFFSLVYSSLLLAKEDMGIPATVEVFASIIKLVFLFIIPFVNIDALVVYSFTILLTSLLQLLFFIIYCWRKHEESHVGHVRDRELQNEILSFSGWSFVNSVAGISLTYLSNIFINLFGGILYNTAYGISQQLSSAVISFSTSVLRAADPQITSSTIADQDSYRNQLVLSSIKLCTIGVGFVFLLFLFYGDFLLKTWLNEVPEHVLPFCRVTLLSVIVSSAVLPIKTIILASGNIKRFYLNYLYMALLANGLMFGLLKLGFPVITVMYLILAAGLGYFINAVIIVNKSTSLRCTFVFNALLRVAIALLSGAVILYASRVLFPENAFGFLFGTIVSFIIVIIVAYSFVANTLEREYIKMIVNRFRKK